MARKKTVVDDGHRMGTRCGYTEVSPGVIRPAPLYADRFARLQEQTRGVNDMLKMVTSTSSDMLAEINRQYRQLWTELEEDYGLDVKAYKYVWNGKEIVREEQPAQPAKPVEKP